MSRIGFRALEMLFSTLSDWRDWLCKASFIDVTQGWAPHRDRWSKIKDCDLWSAIVISNQTKGGSKIIHLNLIKINEGDHYWWLLINHSFEGDLENFFDEVCLKTILIAIMITAWFRPDCDGDRGSLTDQRGSQSLIFDHPSINHLKLIGTFNHNQSLSSIRSWSSIVDRSISECDHHPWSSIDCWEMCPSLTWPWKLNILEDAQNALPWKTNMHFGCAIWIVVDFSQFDRQGSYW